VTFDAAVDIDLSGDRPIFPDTFGGRPDVGLVAQNVAASSFEPLRDRRREWRRRRELLARARRFVYVSTYYLEWDRYGREFLDALAAARRRGAHVVLVVDGFGQRLGGVAMAPENRRSLRRALDDLRRLGAEVVFYAPRRRIQRWLGGGQHVKIQICEDGRALFGSSNVTASSYERWDELSAVLAGPVVLALLDSFPSLDVRVRPQDRETVARVSRDPGADPILFDYCAFNPNPVQGGAGPLGWRTTNALTLGLRQAVRQARESVALTSFYYKPAPLLRREILAARARGVRVAVYHSHLEALSETRLAWLAAAADFGPLLAAGVEIHESRHGEHSKVMLVDDRVAMLGSYNFEHAADDRLAEAMLASTDPRVVAAVKHVLEECARTAEPMTIERLGRLPFGLRWQRLAVKPLRRWM
jgi:cardiolipin synthase A/B